MGEISNLDQYQVYRSQVEKEREDTNQKVMWNLLAQSFLFSAYATLINNLDKERAEPFQSIFNLLLHALPSSGFLVAIILLISLGESALQISQVRKKYESEQPASKDFRLPPIEKYGRLHILSRAMPFTMPLVFLVIWMLVLWADVFTR